MVAALERTYAHVNDIDLFTGLLAERSEYGNRTLARYIIRNWVVVENSLFNTVYTVKIASIGA